MARTIGHNTAKSSEWRAAGAQEKDLKNFYNCHHPPLVAKGEPERKVVELLPPPSLHIIIDLVNKLFPDLFW